MVTQDASKVLAPVGPIPEWIYRVIWVIVDELCEYRHELLGETPSYKAIVGA